MEHGYRSVKIERARAHISCWAPRYGTAEQATGLEDFGLGVEAGEACMQAEALVQPVSSSS
jgi:hypothetical protein